MSINAPEGYPLEDFSAEAIRNQIAEAQKIASGNGSEQDIAEAKIELEVCATSSDNLRMAHVQTNTAIDPRDPRRSREINIW